MGGKKRSETAIAFLRRISEQDTDKEAREFIEEAMVALKDQQLALSVLGTLSIVIVPGGAFHYSLSPHLMMRRETLDWVDQALSDTQGFIRELRAKVIERDIAQAKQLADQEEPNGENSIDSPGRS